jgi:Insertion element 4 transposase N-terminal/Transposase DDE domain
MPHGWGSARGRVLARVGLGILSWVIPPDVVDEAVGDGLAWEMRLRSLPSRLGVYFVLACALLSARPYPQVIRQVTRGVKQALAAAGWQVPASTALTGVRRRVGERPLESVFRRVCSALSPGRAAWSHLGGLLLVAVDGTTVGVADSAANAAAFGRGGGGAGPAGSPAMRLVTLMACGTRGLLDAVFGPVRGKGTGEQALAGQLLGSLRAGMLVLADRNFYSWALWHAAARTGADLLWRATSSMQLTVLAELPDGSFLAHVNDPAAVQARNRRNGQRRRRGSGLPPQTGPLPGMTVRVIEFTVTVTGDDGSTRTAWYRLITTLPDHRRYPAADLAAAYARRWAIETGFAELKTALRGSGRLLRGRTPELARQELWAYLAVYQALRTLIARAAARDGLDPARISFTAARDAAELTLGTAPGSLDEALAAAETEMLNALVPLREGRIWPRAVKKTRSSYKSRGSRPGPLAQHGTCTVTVPAPRRTTENTTDQARQPAQHAGSPP